MRKLITIILLILLGSNLNGQNSDQTEVLLLGTYHFGGVTSDRAEISNDGILSDKKQKEIEALINKLKTFQPDKIYVENPPEKQEYWDSIYSDYRNGKKAKLKSEIYQIGIKLADKLSLDQGITCVNWTYSDDSYATQKYIEYRNKIWDYDSIQVAKYGDQDSSLYLKKSLENVLTKNDSIPKMSILNVFRTLNSNKELNRIFYTNVSGMLDQDEYEENVFWSQNAMLRNAHIYQNIITDILEENPKRVLILFGQAHIKPLQLYFESHPKIKLIDTEKILQ